MTNGTCTVYVTITNGVCPCPQDQHFAVDHILSCPSSTPPSSPASTPASDGDSLPHSQSIPTIKSSSVTTTSTPNSPTSHRTGTIVGSVVGGLVLLLLACAMLLFCWKRRNMGKWISPRRAVRVRGRSRISCNRDDMSIIDGVSAAPALTTWSPELFTRPPTNQDYYATVTHPRPYADSISERGSTDSQDESAETFSRPSSSKPLKGSQAQSQNSISTAAATDEHAYAYEVHTPSATHAPAHAHPSSSSEDLWLRAKQAPSRQSLYAV